MSRSLKSEVYFTFLGTHCVLPVFYVCFDSVSQLIFFFQDTVFDLPIGNLSVTNNGIQASQKHVAFCIDGEGTFYYFLYTLFC